VSQNIEKKVKESQCVLAIYYISKHILGPHFVKIECDFLFFALGSVTIGFPDIVYVFNHAHSDCIPEPLDILINGHGLFSKELELLYLVS
jgi:hypothetical protein